MKPLWQHQIDGIKHAEYNKNIFLAFEQGTGKTRTAIEIMRRRFAAKGRLMRTLILCPIIVADNWKREWLMYSKVNSKDILVLTASGAKRCAQFREACDGGFPKIVVTNYQGMLIDDLYSTINEWKPEIILCDESHRVKGHTSKTAKKVLTLADAAEQKILLTGTPILNTPMDLWMQFRILDGGSTFGTNFFAFRATYFRDANAGWSSKPGHFPKWEPTKDTYSSIQAKIKGKMLRVLKSECLDLPPLIRQEVDVSLSPDQAKVYKQMKDQYLAYVESIDGKHSATVTAQLAVTKALRLQQILTGYVASDDGKLLEFEKNPRLDALEELLEDITPHSKVIVWSCFIYNYKMILKVCEKLKIEYAQIHGEISNSDRIKEMDRFRTDPRCRVMVANQSAGGSGINLVEASYAIYYSKNFSLENDLQSEARCHRGGSEIHQKITRIDLVARGTLDEVINIALSKKQNVADTILTWKG